MISSAGPLGTALGLYRYHLDRYAASLDDLLEKPAGGEDGALWQGPYIQNPSDLRDAWSQSLRYRMPGKINTTGYDLWSVGPDGVDGTEDDICNW